MGEERLLRFISRFALVAPATAFLTVFLVFFVFASEIHVREKDSLHQLVTENSTLITAHFREVIESQMSAISRMSDRWKMNSSRSERAWRKDATNYLRDLPGLKVIGLEAPPADAHWVEYGKGDENFAAEIKHPPAFSGEGKTVASADTSKHRLFIWNPLTASSDNSDYIVGGFDLEQILHLSLSPLIAKYYNVTLGVVDAEAIKKVDPSLVIERQFDIDGISLTLKVLPTSALLAARTSPLSKALLICGFLLALLTATAVYYAKRSIAQAGKLYEQEASFHLLVNGVVDYAIYMLDTTGHIKSWNSGAQRIKQYEPKDILGKHFSVFFTPEDVIRLLPSHALSVASETGRFEAEGWRVRKDGSRFWASVVIDALKDAKGNLLGFAKVTRDITVIREQAERLKASEETFRLAMEHAAIGKALVSPEGKFLKANHALCKMLGYEEPELLRLDFQAITHPEDLEADIACLQQVLHRELDSYQMEKRYYHKHGHTIWVLLTVSLVWNADNTPRYFVSEIQNLTAQKKNESEREALIQKLVDTNSELERFAFVASHDLQEPLRLICNLSNLLQRSDLQEMGGEERQYIDIIVNSAFRMHLLINDLLEYARIGNSEDMNELFESRECVTYVVDNLQGVINHACAQMTYDVLPQLYGSPVRFSTLMQNLVGNALKYRRQDVPLEICIGAYDKGQDWVFYVKDNGIGIKPEYCEQIFEPFKRLHNKDEYPGTGMGLAICRKIAEQVGGRMWVESSPGNGSSFYFSIPKYLATTSSNEAA